jgi:hypothetical protein
MKTKLTVLLLNAFLIVIGLGNMQAQVVVGANESPVNGALLQLKSVKDADSAGDVNATQGLGLPRVQLVKKDQLQPMYSEADATALDDATKKAHKGLLVFNILEVEDEDLSAGLNFWDGEKWIAVSETQSKAEVEVDCSKVRVYGQYYRRSPVTSTNYIIMPIKVLKKGDYSIIASTGNGYYFQASGVFDSTGTFEVRLEAMGTPSNSGVDGVSFTNNGSPIGSLCSVEITVGIASLTYRINSCDDIKVFGDYQTRAEVSSFTNYVEIPVEVIMDGTTTWETELINGVKFVANQTFTDLGDAVLVVKAQGVPKKSGKYTYNFTTDGSIKNQCSFVISVTSTLGTFADPACKCLDIYEERPDVTNGEYFLRDCLDASETPVKTYCDIVNGGYTLVWSFSERVAYSTYIPVNSMVVGNSGQYIFSTNIPRNRVTTEDGTINYSDYRLTRDEFRHFPNSTTNPTLKVRIAENPTDMNDAWALNNYGVVSPRTVAQNPIETTFGALARVPATGKIWGKKWEVRTSGGGGYGGLYEDASGQMVSHPYIAFYNNTTYTTHWDFGLAGSSTLFQVVPNKGASNNEARISMMNNAFGWFGETQGNHHFGKCGGASADDYDFTTKTCGSGTGTLDLKPHNTINGGEGRYMQWFVK